MKDILGLLFLILFGLTTGFSYLAVRRAWMRILFVAAIGIVGDMLFIMWYSLTKGTWFIQALITGIVLGILFTVLTVSVAMYFRANDPVRTANIPKSPPKA